MERSDPVRVGIIGGGLRGAIFARALQENLDAELVAICDQNPAIIDAHAPKLSIPGYTDVAQMLIKHPKMNAVIIATPDFAHRQVAISCAEAGLDMFIEKPLATSMADAWEIHRTVQENGVRVMLGFENRWNVRYTSVRELLAADTNLRISAQIINLNDTIFVPTEMLSWANKSSPAWFLMPHTLDLACWIGNSSPVSVYAVGERNRLKANGIDTWDRINAIFTMTDGSHVILNSSWTLPKSMPSVFDFRYEIQTDSRTIHINGADQGVLDYGSERVSWVQSAIYERDGRIKGVPIDMIGDFIKFLRDEITEVPNIYDGLRNTIAIAAIHDSLAQGTAIDISLSK